MAKSKKLWGGRFNSPTHPLVEKFTESISYDFRLAKYDIIGSCAHAEMLAKIGVIKKAEAQKIIRGLKSILKDIEKNKIIFRMDLEDIHMNIETELTNRIGKVAGKLHTGRSRNDQVALDERLYLRDIISQQINLLVNLQKALIFLAEKNEKLIVPGFTHLQFAMPVMAAHQLLAYVEKFERDKQRLSDQLKRVNVLPLGSAALAGSGFPHDRKFVAKKLGFDSISANSMDAVSDRDYFIEYLSTTALIGTHLSRISEDFILWASQPFGFVDIADAFCTGSSLMPNKKNPDVLEIIRGKCGRLYGNLVSLLTIMKGLPMTYNRDIQEDKEPVFDSADTISDCLEILAELVPTIIFNETKIEEALQDDFLFATDWADYLVKKGVPFREAHELIGRAVAIVPRGGNKKCMPGECPGGLSKLPLSELKKLSPEFDSEILKINNATASVKSKKSPGSANPLKVKKEIKRWKSLI